VRIRLIIIAVTAAVLALGGIASAKQDAAHGNKPPPVTKMKFKLDDHHVTLGTPVTGSVHVWSRDQHHWVALPDAALSLTVDGTEVATLTTDAEGTALVSYDAAAEGGHVMKVWFAGDDLHKRAMRAQGFEVAPGA